MGNHCHCVTARVHCCESRELDFESCQIRPNFDSDYNLPIYLTSNGITFMMVIINYYKTVITIQIRLDLRRFEIDFLVCMLTCMI